MTLRPLCLAMPAAILLLAAAPPPVPNAATANPTVNAVAAQAAQTTPVPIAVSGARTVPTRPPAPRHHRGWTPSPAIVRVAAATRAATEEPDRTSFINAVQVYPFGDGALYHVYTAPGQVTDIALQPGEALGAVAAGDTARWVIGDTSSGAGEEKRTHVLVKPYAAGLATNLVITTDRRVYHLALTSTVRTAMTALSWTYPQDQLIALRKAAAASADAAPVAAGISVDQLRFDYAVSGDKPDWRPVRAFDDGRQTFIEFPPTIATGVAPPLFVVDAKGEASLVNYRVNGRFYVVDRLFDVAELRFGLKHQDIVRITRGPILVARRAS